MFGLLLLLEGQTEANISAPTDYLNRIYDTFHLRFCLPVIMFIYPILFRMVLVGIPGWPVVNSKNVPHVTIRLFTE